MARKPRTNPRKIASQERSRATVDALLEATTRILLREGYDQASTNKIAEVAGVSIGSLYQYFPSKEALVAAVIDRHTQEISRVVRRALVKVAARPLEVAAREFVSIGIDAHRVNPKLHAVLAEQIPRVGRLENIDAMQRDGYALVRGYLEAHRDEI
ncbi:MAG TPA: TetR/AcrR family transcriptional regulator, partial [Candidatus Binataceae bacterium]|nr:TetR/AcrR family transcriptional regulator [Candidatus Binataceae bacterium]